MSMFHSRPLETVATPQTDADPVEELIPLSHLQLDLDPPVEGWPAYLAARGVAITLDDIGRAAIARDDARQLLTERREVEAHAREKAAAVERAAVEADQLRRAQMGHGVPAGMIPTGMSPAEALFAAELDAHVYRPRRSSVVEDLLDNSGMTFHPIQHDGNES